ncbi:hypothetical protein SKAU_G00012550 [Synaphobranchus kaupii]|uniref:Uncharacterized protein n=1 Tax=Synaphobranchus kaupii TaxID=118154 RepID=A0A9Q1GC45_SYNKA|nr:hypothetical protein SKAU_G00012550 [Synaphobranchus kaupii]
MREIRCMQAKLIKTQEREVTGDLWRQRAVLGRPAAIAMAKPDRRGAEQLRPGWDAQAHRGVHHPPTQG